MATISFITKFDLSLSTKQFVFTDTSDYAGQGISVANVNGVFQIVAPSGAVIYNNTDYSDSGCDIKVSTSLINKIVIALPIGSDGIVELGNYTVIYSVKDITAAPVFYTKENTYDNEYQAVTIDILQDVNIIGAIFSQTDLTNYVVNGITPTISRTNTLTYPAGVSGGPPAPLITTAATLRTSVFFNGTQTSTIQTLVSYQFVDGLVVYDSLFGSKEILIDGSYFCSILCGIKAYEKKLCNCNADMLVIYQKNFTLIMSYVTLIMAEIECNGGSNISDYLNKIDNIVGDCNCGGCNEDDNFSRITGWGSLVGADGAPGTNGTNGTNGANGADGVNGVSILSNNIVVNTPSSGVYASLKNYTLIANQLSQNGDAVEVKAVIEVSDTTNIKNVKVLIGGADAMPKLTALGYIKMDSNNIYLDLDIVITRKSATTVFITYKGIETFGSPFYSGYTSYGFYEPSITVNDLTTLTNLIDIQGKTTTPDTIVCKQLMVKYLKVA